MLRFLRRIPSLVVLLAIIAAAGLGISVTPNTPPQADAQTITYAHFLDWPNNGVCSGIAGNEFTIQFPVSPIHYTHTFDRSGNIGLCAFNGLLGAFYGSLNVPAASGVATFNQIAPSSCLGLNASNVLVGDSDCIFSITAGDNITVSAGPSPVVAVASPIATSFPPAACAGWSTSSGGPLAIYTCPPSPYPTPATPTPLPSPSSGNPNCSWSGLVITCVTPTPAVVQAVMVMTLPTTLASTGATSFPVPINPYWTNIQVTGAASSCATAGTGTPETFTFLQSATTQGTYVTAAPTAFVLATGNAPGVVETIAPTAFVSPTPNGGFLVAKVLAQNGTTARSGICTYTLFVSHQ